MKAIKASYRVEIRREREAMTRLMSAIREWLDARRFEPDTLRCATDEESVTFLIDSGLRMRLQPVPKPSGAG